MQKIVPNLWFDRTAAEAADFYVRALPDTTSEITFRYPTEGLPDFQKDFAGEPVTVDVTVGDYRITLINAGSEFAPTPSGSFTLNFDPLLFGGDAGAARTSLDAVWNALADGGSVLMDLGEYPFSARYGWVKDRYGVSWQLTLTDPEGDPRPFVIPSLLFVGEAQDRAREAGEYYVSLFEDAGIGTVYPYPEQTGPAAEGAVMFSDFRLAGQWFTAMDSGVEMDAAFTPAFSLEVRCADQAEIDRLWAALSAVPDAEQCGWLTDRFGLSWQIVPAGMSELLRRPGAYQRMLEMKKIVIADL
ncbi:MAG: VOC family protein [Microbacteriaceae bacterium]